MTYNPFHVIRDNPAWTLWTWAELPEGELGRWYNDEEVMLLDRGLSRIQRRCTAAHEVEHALAGDTGCTDTGDDDYFTIKSERRANARAARKLIPLDAFIEALRMFEGDDQAIIEHLDVDQEMLDARRECLQPAERHTIRLALAPQEDLDAEERATPMRWNCLGSRRESA